MKKLCLMAMLFLFSSVTFCEEIIAKSRINSVEVFSDRAIVERTTTIDIPVGSHTVVFEGLSPSVIENTLKVSGKGSASCEIMGTEVTNDEIDIPCLKELDQQIEANEIEKKKVNASLSLLTEQENLLDSILTNSTIQTGKEVSEGKPDTVAIDKLFGFLTIKYEEINTKSLALDLKLSELTKKKAELTKQRQELLANKTKKRKKASILVICNKPGNLTLSLFYTVKGCSWSPAYIAKAFPESSKIEITMMASIVQKTYEDWENASITLSTASPSMGVMPPDLNPTFIDLYVPQPVKRSYEKAEVSGGIEGGVEGGVLGGVVADSIPRGEEMVVTGSPPAVKEEPIVIANYSNVSLSEAGVHLNFSVKGRIDVASDGKTHRFFISKDNIDGNYDYYGIPRKDDKAFMRCVFTNTMDYPILPGEVELFYDGELVGSAYLPFIARNEKAEAYFGRNNEIALNFEEAKNEKVEQNLLGGKRRVKFQNRITIENHTRNEIKIEVLDKLPKPQRAEIELVDIKIVPNRDSEKPNNILSWILTLKPQEKKEIMIDFTIEYPKGFVLKGI